MSAKYEIELLALGARTGTGTSPTLDLDLADTTLRLWLEATVAGDAAAQLTVEHSRTGAAWETLGSFTSRTTAGEEYKVFPGARRFVRVKWTTTGTAWTLRVAGEQVIVYATPADVKLLGLRADVMAGSDGVSDAELDRAVEAAQNLIDSYLQSAVDQGLAELELPLEDPVVFELYKRPTSIIAGYDLVSARVGYDPDRLGDDPFRKRYDDVIRWLEGIASGDVAVPGPTPDPGGGTTVGRVLEVTSEEPWGL